MKRTTAYVGALLLCVAVAAVAAGGVAATTLTDATTPASTTPASTTTPTDGAAGASGTFGAEISTFMQSSTAAAEGQVEDGMFSAGLSRVDDPDERRALIERRQERLRQRQVELEERRERISEGDGPGLRDRALAAHVAVGAAQLERSANGTERAARAAGLDTEALEEIRSNAREMRGPAIAALARNLTGGPSAGERGPPFDVPGGEFPDDGLPSDAVPGDGPLASNGTNARGKARGAATSDEADLDSDATAESGSSDGLDADTTGSGAGPPDSVGSGDEANDEPDDGSDDGSEDGSDENPGNADGPASADSHD